MRQPACAEVVAHEVARHRSTDGVNRQFQVARPCECVHPMPPGIVGPHVPNDHVSAGLGKDAAVAKDSTPVDAGLIRDVASLFCGVGCLARCRPRGPRTTVAWSLADETLNRWGNALISACLVARIAASPGRENPRAAESVASHGG